MELNKLPREWKDAHVIPVYKKRSKTSANSHHPISLTSVNCKVSEELIRSVLDHMIQNKFLSDKLMQFEEEIALQAKKNLKAFYKYVNSKVKTRNCMGNLTQLRLLFTALARSHLEYGNVIWHPFLQKDIQMLEKGQHRATRMVQGLANQHFEDRLKLMKLQSLASIAFSGQ